MKVIGHRGASGIAPENTWESFDLALQLGTDALSKAAAEPIETDIQATSDGELILIHDPDLTRTTNGKGLVAMTSWVQISQLDAGSWFDRAYYGAKVPRLRETLERYSHKTHFVLEIKQKGIEAEVVKMVQELNLIEAVTLTCFDVEVVQNIKQLCPEINLEWLIIKTDETKMSQARKIGVNHVCLSAPLISAEIVSRWQAIDLPVRAWNVTDSDVMISALQSGVEAMTVDHLHLLINILKHY